MNHPDLFAFEDDFVQTLRCVPMAVRIKLDLCGIKLSLRQWSRFSVEDRRELLEARCDSPGAVEAFGAALVELIAARAGEAPTRLTEPVTAFWDDDEALPEPVCRFARSRGVAPPSLAQWRRLRPLERFALGKLSRDNHDNVNFLPAMREFGLAPTASRKCSSR